MENVIQQLVSYAEQLIPRGMDFLLSIAVGILVFAVGSKLIKKLWKGIGYGSVLYLSALAGFDQQIYEAADIDGATAWQKLWRITIPMLMPTVIVMTLLGLGNIMHSETGLFYQVTQNNAMLYNTTQVLDSFVLNALMKNTDYGMTSAATFYQSVVGFIMVMATNWFVRKASPDDALF